MGKSVDEARSDARKDVFLSAFSITGIIQDGVDSANVTRKTYYYWLETDPVFAERVKEAAEEANDNIRKNIYTRALGYQKPLHYKGRLTGDTIEEYSESMLTLLARSRMPKEFRQNTGIELSEAPELATVRERFLDRLAAMVERVSDEPTESE